MSDDKNNIHYLRFKPKNIDKESLQYFFEGATEYAAYQDAESFSAACMVGISKALEKRLGSIKDDGFHGDIAVIAVLLVGAYMRQAGVLTPEIKLLNDIRDGLKQQEQDNDSD
jgi:hypothetical protein